MEKFDPAKPVQTINGKKARILCTNLINDGYPIAAAITVTTKPKPYERIFTFTKNGKFSKDGIRDCFDLINI